MDKLKQYIQNNLSGLDIDQPKEDLWNALSNEINHKADQDPLKEHIEQYADELDLETPGEQSWSKIRSEISAQNPVRLISYKKLAYYVAAACLVLFIVAGVVLYKSFTPSTRNGDDIVSRPSKTEVTVPKLPANDTMKIMAQGPSAINDDKKRAGAEKVELTRKIKDNYAIIRSKPAFQNTGNKKLPSIIIQTQAAYDDLIAGQVSLIQSIPMYGESAGDFEGFIDDFKRLDKQEKRLRATVMQKGMEENTLDELALIYQKKLTVLKMLQREIGKTSSNSRSETDTIPVFIKL